MLLPIDLKIVVQDDNRLDQRDTPHDHQENRIYKSHAASIH